MIYVYIYSILLHIMHIFTNRFLVLSESKADIRNPLSLLAHERTWDLARDSGQCKLTDSSQDHGLNPYGECTVI